jgi:hypothetical protein
MASFLERGIRAVALWFLGKNPASLRMRIIAFFRRFAKKSEKNGVLYSCSQQIEIKNAGP